MKETNTYTSKVTCQNCGTKKRVVKLQGIPIYLTELKNIKCDYCHCIGYMKVDV